MADKYLVFESIQGAALGASMLYVQQYQVFQVQSLYRPWLSDMLRPKTEYMLCTKAHHPDWVTAERILKHVLEDDNERLSEPREVIDKIDVVLDTYSERAFIPEELEGIGQ